MSYILYVLHYICLKIYKMCIFEEIYQSFFRIKCSTVKQKRSRLENQVKKLYERRLMECVIVISFAYIFIRQSR